MWKFPITAQSLTPQLLTSGVYSFSVVNLPNPTTRLICRWSLGIVLFASFFFTGCHYHDFPEYASNYREYAYIANQGGNTVTVLDLVNLRLDRVLTVGQQPWDVAVNPLKNEVYVVNRQPQATGTVSVINTETNKLTASIYVRRLPIAIAVAPDGQRAYVLNSGSNSVSIIDLQTRRELAVAPTGQQPVSLRVAPDGRSLVVSNQKEGSISIFTILNDSRRPLELRATIGGCAGASSLAILPDSSKVFTACSAPHAVMAVALAQAPDSYAVKQNGASTRDQQLVLLDVGKTPVHLAMKPDGGEIFVSNYDGDSISEIATGEDEVGGTYFIGSKPSYGLVSADNTTLWISNFGSDTITAYAIDDGKINSVVRTGMAPTALAFTSAGHLLLATDSRSGDVSVIRTQAHDQYTGRSLFTLLPAGPQPGAIAVKSFLLK